MTNNAALNMVLGEVPSMISAVKQSLDPETAFDALALEQHLLRFKACPERDEALKLLGEYTNKISNELLLESVNVLTPEGWIEEAKALKTLTEDEYEDQEFIKERSALLLMQLDDGQLGLLNIQRRLNRKVNIDLTECIDFVEWNTEVFMTCLEWTKIMTEGYEFLPDLQRRDQELYDTLGVLYAIICEDDYRKEPY